MTTLVDSDVLITHLRGQQVARDWLIEQRRVERLVVSAVTVAEVLGGMRSAERHEVRDLIASFDCQPVSEQVAQRAGELRRTYRRSHAAIGIADYLIAATAKEHRLQLATLNVRHFPMFDGLRAPFVL